MEGDLLSRPCLVCLRIKALSWGPKLRTVRDKQIIRTYPWKDFLRGMVLIIAAFLCSKTQHSVLVTAGKTSKPELENWHLLVTSLEANHR